MSISSLFHASAATQYHRRGDLVHAEEEYRKAIAAGDRDPSRFLSFGVLLLQEGNLQEGIEILTRALQFPMDDRTKASVRTNRALGYLLNGQSAKALAALEDLHENYRCAQVYQALGYAYIKTEQYDKALPYCLEALDYDDQDTVILDNLAQLYIALERWEDAQDILNRAFAIREKQADMLYHQALCDLHRQDREHALLHVRDALECPINALNDVSRDTLEKMEQDLVSLNHER